MMKDKDLQMLLTKSEELKALFILGQRVIPFLEELFVFVREVSPALEDINKSIEENISRIPKASKQLSKVTEATEMATNEIMDTVDGMTYKINVLEQNLKQLQTRYLAVQHACSSVVEVARAGLSNGQMGNPYLTKIEEILVHTDVSESYSELFANSEGVLGSVRMDTNNIMMSLQVQDITSQQIAAVNHVIEAIQGKLNSILTRFNTSDLGPMQGTPRREAVEERRISSANVSSMHRSIAFDPDAVESMMGNKTQRQADVDDLVTSMQNDIGNDVASEDDISAMFSASQTVTAMTEVSAEAEQVHTMSSASDDAFDAVSQDDIDALFKTL